MRTSIFCSILLAAVVHLQATPPADPICGTPSSLDLVTAIRRQMLREQKLRRGTLNAFQAELPPRLSIARDKPLDLPRLIMSGSAGRSYELEAISGLGSSSWQSILTVNLGQEPLSWDDVTIGGGASYQFFRMRAGEPDAMGDSASNFRLLDQQGTARDLYYHTHLSAIVVVAAGTDLTKISSWTNILAELAKTYTNRIQTWILHSDPSAIRSNVLTQAKALNLGFPVLADKHGLAARSLGLTRAGEVAVVQPPIFTVAYRGALSGVGQLTGAQSYLGQALASLNYDQPLTYRRTLTAGALLNHLGAATPNYSRDIAPILHKHCAQCHRSDGVAPFALTNYSVAHEWSASIKHAVLSGKMPPWHADPEYGRFANDLSLPGESKSALVRWIDAGAPRGDGGDPLAELPAPSAHDQWPAELGEPDALVTIPVQNIKAEGVEPYRYIYVQAPNPTNSWLRAAIIRPSNYRAVHHYLVWLDRIGNSGGPDTSSYQNHIAEYVPGYKPFVPPADSYMPLSRSNWLTFNLHYNTIQVATNDQPVLALWYHKTRPAKVWGAAVGISGVATTSYVIPPRSADYPVQAEWQTPSPITLYRMNPHMHLRGKRMKYEVVYPGGRRETLLSVPDYDFNWQIGYDLAQPKAIPAGSRIIVSGAFDNSAQNLANPDPSATVRHGDQSYMEMFAGFIDYTQ